MTDTAEQREIRSSVRKLAEKELPAYQNEAHAGSFPRPLFRELAKLGLTALAIGEEHGGLAAGPATTAIVMEELAAVDLGPAIFTSVHSMVSGLIQRYGSPEQRERYLPRMAAGEMLGAYALTEPGAGSDAAALSSTALPDADGHVLNGEKCFITSAGAADVYAVFARTSPGDGKSGISAFLLDKDAPGLEIAKPEKKMGCELSPIASLAFKDIRLSEQCLLGGLGEGYSIALSGLAGGRVNIAACGLGLSRSAIHLALTHLQNRKQFGHPLIEQQGLQFMLADMQMKLEASRLLVAQAAAEIERDPGSPLNRLYPSIAKCFATDAAMSITTDAVQLLGGAGYIREYQVERLMRDAKMLQIVEGTNQIQRVIIAREMAKQG